jgi:dienelactone hydrolase
MLAGRLVAAIDWLRRSHVTLPIGVFGASTGAAAALVAAARKPAEVMAVVSRGGRPDLAGRDLEAVRAPTLLIVGGWDEVVLGLNRRAMRQMQAPTRLEIIPGATHLFEERGALERVAVLAREWFVEHMPSVAASHR